jgi:hypothetical protein
VWYGLRPGHCFVVATAAAPERVEAMDSLARAAAAKSFVAFVREAGMAGVPVLLLVTASTWRGSTAKR